MNAGLLSMKLTMTVPTSGQVSLTVFGLGNDNMGNRAETMR